MTKKLHHTIPEGVTLRLDVNGNTVKTFTVPANALLTVKAHEIAFFDPDTRLEVYVDGQKHLDYTVPAGYRAIVETELEDLE